MIDTVSLNIFTLSSLVLFNSDTVQYFYDTYFCRFVTFKSMSLISDLKNYQMTSKILPRLRELMTLNKFTWYVLPRSDEHQSEYLAKCDERVAFLSGFTGSNAIAIVSQEQALLWTDGRYFLQAEKQLYEGWTMKKLIASEKKWFEHISDSYKEGATIGIDSRLITAASAELRFKTLQEKGYKIIAQPKNLVDEIWETKPGSSACDIFVHEEWAGKGIQQKVNWIREQIKQKQGNGALFSDLSEIAWVLNLRSGQIPYNPFFKSILVIKLQGGFLYLPKGHPSRDNQTVIDHLKKADIKLAEYDPEFPEKTLVQKSSLNHYIYSNLKDPIEWQGIGLQRAVRTDKEINGFRNCHVRDAIAQVKFWTWRSKQEKVNEYQAAQYINNRRLELEHNKGLSFDTISSGGANAAMIHYSPTETNNSDITNDMIHLVDSGGQYLDGTTDVTRTFHFGKPTPEERDSYTRVLLGNLDVERVQWPKNSKITGGDIDVLARRHLWAAHKDYLHGTGHGVGYYLGVHEGPVGISKHNQTVFEPNMIVTNEPGYYENGKYGIRIENILVVKEDKEFYGFECLTLCPYDWNLIDQDLLTKKDRDYINKYHARVRETLLPLLKDDKETIEWLTHATREV